MNLFSYSLIQQIFIKPILWVRQCIQNTKKNKISQHSRGIEFSRLLIKDRGILALNCFITEISSLPITTSMIFELLIMVTSHQPSKLKIL